MLGFKGFGVQGFSVLGFSDNLRNPGDIPTILKDLA